MTPKIDRKLASGGDRSWANIRFLLVFMLPNGVNHDKYLFYR